MAPIPAAAARRILVGLIVAANVPTS